MPWHTPYGFGKPDPADDTCGGWTCSTDSDCTHIPAGDPPFGTPGCSGRRCWSGRDSADCVAFNYPDPGNGYCWIKRGDGWKKSTVLNKNCGWSSSFDYYTLVSRTAQSPKSLLQPPSDVATGWATDFTWKEVPGKGPAPLPQPAT